MTYIYKTFTVSYDTEVSSQIEDYLSTVLNHETSKIAICDQNSESTRDSVITEPDLKQTPETLFCNSKWVDITDSFPLYSNFEPKIAEFRTILNNFP